MGSVALALTNDGNRIVIGSPDGTDLVGPVNCYEGTVTVHSYANGAWSQSGNILSGEQPANCIQADGSDFGAAVALNEDGTKLVVGDPSMNNDVGRVYTYAFDGTIWNDTTNRFDGSVAGQRFGSSVASNAVGDIVAVGSDDDSGNGYINVYQNENNVWGALGSEFTNENSGDQVGHDVSLSNDGLTLILSAHDAVTSGGGAVGKVKAYIFTIPPHPLWIPYGGIIEGGAFDINFGECSSIVRCLRGM